MNQQDDFDRSLARWFESEPRPAGTTQVLARALASTRGRRPRPWPFAALGSRWIRDSGRTGAATLGRNGLRTALALLLLLLALALVTGAVLVGVLRPEPAPSLGIFAPVAGKIVYGDSQGIWGVDPDGSAATRVLVTAEPGTPLEWSRDGTRLLVVRDEQVILLNADGSETPLTTDQLGSRVSTLSPDGSRVVFGTRRGLFAVDTAGGPAKMLLELEGLEDVSFAPDGMRIAYVTGSGDNGHRVSVMDADGTGAHEILANDVTLGPGHDHGLAWSPAGDRIALGIAGVIYTFAPDGSGFTPANRSAGRLQPFWSPDGTQLETKGPWHPAPIRSNEPPRVSTDDPTPAPSAQELRRDGEVIVFAGSTWWWRNERLGWDLGAQDPETGEVRKIVKTDGIVDCPDRPGCVNFVRRAEWSPDGRWIAFQVSHLSLDGPPLGPCGPTVGLWVASARSGPRQVTTPCETAPGAEGVEELWAWSPDGARLAVARVDGASSDLFVIEPADGSRTRLATNTGGLTALEWAPDGRQIAVADRASVSKVSADGGGQTLLADSFGGIVDIGWSPDSSRILVQDQGRYRIQVMNADGTDLHAVLEGADACCSTAWSPAGDRILYMLSVIRPGEPESGLFDSQVWTVSPDGSDAIEVFASDGCAMGSIDSLPVWAPNGTQVAYNDCGIWVVANADGTGEPRPLGGARSDSGGPPLLHRSWDGGGLSSWDLAKNGQWDH